ncbi:MAG: heavy metal translocating P-type ATPase [Clostridiales bacterium]|nr:heavy metal translocating P-type ATPase [Clostridiales bacterium]
MKFTILHDSNGRMRIHAAKRHMTLEEADILEYYLRSIPGVGKVSVYDRTCDAVIYYTCNRANLIDRIAKFRFDLDSAKALVPAKTGRALNREFENKLLAALAGRMVRLFLLPLNIRKYITIVRSFKYILKGLKCLMKGKIEVPVLDATAITAAMLTGDFGTAASIMFLLRIGDILDEWTHRKSVNDLAGAMSLGVDKVWVRKDGEEISVPVHSVSAGDEIVVRTGNMIPLDGRVVSGEMTVNQASMTGESDAVPKSEGSLVYAGTVVEDGECVVRVENTAGTGRYDRIVKMIEDSEKLKSETEDKASHLADKLVPYSLAATGITYLLTRNVTKALAILMVDFSCALKLSMPIAVLSAMREASTYHISFKGGKYIEAVSEADTIVFDKTGTLTHASPHIAGIEVFGGHEENDILRVAACLEEHYPHSIANAVVKEAAARGINHAECHTSVEYIVAHGILGTVDGKRVAIGSHHFLFDDEKCTIPDKEKFDAIPDEYSHLYMAIGGELAAVLLIEDPIRIEAPEVIEKLHSAGFTNIVMMTGDSDRTAKAVAAKVGVDRYFSEVLPEDKASYVKKMREEGHKVIMIGDGINDAPALSESNAGVAVSGGAAIAREIADITITADDLGLLLVMKELSNRLMGRIHSNYRFIMSFNLGLIILGVMGVLPPSASALLHNVSTLAISLKSMTDLLED